MTQVCAFSAALSIRRFGCFGSGLRVDNPLVSGSSTCLSWQSSEPAANEHTIHTPTGGEDPVIAR
jgi:hypothetical protein